MKSLSKPTRKKIRQLRSLQSPVPKSKKLMRKRRQKKIKLTLRMLTNQRSKSSRKCWRPSTHTNHSTSRPRLKMKNQKFIKKLPNSPKNGLTLRTYFFKVNLNLNHQVTAQSLQNQTHRCSKIGTTLTMMWSLEMDKGTDFSNNGRHFKHL